LYKILEKYDFLDDSSLSVLYDMHKIFVKAAEISKLEAEDKEVSKTDLEWINTVPYYLARLVMSLVDGNDYIDDPDKMRMAVVADVFTNAETGLVLETAVGIPYRLYIPLNDKQGGKRIAIGYGFGYYEFSQPISNRLDNNQWKAIVYSDSFNMNKYHPSWINGKVMPPK